MSFLLPSSCDHTVAIIAMLAATPESSFTPLWPIVPDSIGAPYVHAHVNDGQSLPFEREAWFDLVFSANTFVELKLGVIWLYAHHFFAGLRYLLLDVHVGIAKQPARTSAVALSRSCPTHSPFGCTWG